MVDEASTPEYRPGQGLAGVLSSVFRKRKIKDDDLAAAFVDAAMLGATFVNARQTSRGAPPPFPGVHQIPRPWAPPPRAAAPPPPPPPPPPLYSAAEVAAAKRVLGFDGVYLALTEDDIKKRRRDLSRKHHPDLAGRNEVDRKRREAKLKEINHAADLLLATVKESPGHA